MITCSYKSLLNKAREVKQVVEQESVKQKSTVDDLVSRMKTTHKLTSLCHIYPDLKDYTPKIPEILDPATSGFSSDCYEDDAKCKRISCLSYTEVKNLLIDTSVIKKFPKTNGVREGKNVLLMVKNIKLDIDYFQFKDFLLSLRAPPMFLKVKFLFYEGDYSLLLQFAKHDQARTFFYSVTKKISNFENFFGKNFEVDWIEVVLSDQPNGKVYNHRSKCCFIRDNFYGVVVRNLPPDTKKSDIEGFLLSRIKVKAKIQQICYLKKEYFTLVILENLESAEITCKALNDKLIKSKETLTSKKIKAHLHPRCCKSRNMEFESIFRSLFKVPVYQENQVEKVTNIEAVKTLLKKINQNPEKKNSNTGKTSKEKKSLQKEKKRKTSDYNKSSRLRKKSKSRKSKIHKADSKKKHDTKAPLPKSPPPPLPVMKMEEEKKMIQGKLNPKRRSTTPSRKESKRYKRSRSRSKSKKRRKSRISHRYSEEYSPRKKTSKYSSASYHSKRHKGDHHRGNYRRESRERKYDHYFSERRSSRRYDRHNDNYRHNSRRHDDHKYDEYDGKRSKRKLDELKNRKRKKEERREYDHDK